MIQDIRIDLLGVTKPGELFEVFASIFLFPSYFGNNWDAFFDIMSSISVREIIGVNDGDLITGVHLIFIHFDSFQESFPKSEQVIFRTILDDLIQNSSIERDGLSFTFEIQYVS